MSRCVIAYFWASVDFPTSPSPLMETMLTVPVSRLRFERTPELDSEFVHGLYVLLMALSSQFPINPTKFKVFSQTLASIYVELYPWYYMPVTFHKIVAHGAEIIATSTLPIGMMGEDAAESRNKVYRQDRQFHFGKRSLQANFTDVFNRAMDSSDPIISSLSIASGTATRRR